MAKILLIASLLGLFFANGNAYLAHITSLVSETVEEIFPAGQFSKTVGRSDQFRRFRRAVTTNKLDDPKQCIRQCNDNETDMIMTATIKNMARMMAIALESVKPEDISRPEKLNSPEFNERIKEKVISSMGPLFEDLCSASKKTVQCHQRCPDSLLRTISLIDHDSSEVFCEPSTNWKNFTDYWQAINCTNATAAEDPCQNKCGPESLVHNVTHLKMTSDRADKFYLKYENDTKLNTAAVGPACQSIACEIDCYKPIMTDRCGAKAYDMYRRMTVIEPRNSLRILKTIKAVGENPRCAPFK